LRAKDQKVIEELYDQYGAALYGIVLKIVVSEAVAQDVLQDAFVKIWKNGPSYDSGRGSLFTWMLNICRNTAIDRKRSADYQQRQKIQELDASVYHMESAAEKVQPEHIGLNGVVGTLEEKYRVVIDLIYFQGFTQQEVQEVLNIPLGTVKSRIRIALRELRRLFEIQQVGVILLLLLAAIF